MRFSVNVRFPAPETTMLLRISKVVSEVLYDFGSARYCSSIRCMRYLMDAGRSEKEEPTDSMIIYLYSKQTIDAQFYKIIFPLQFNVAKCLHKVRGTIRNKSQWENKMGKVSKRKLGFPIFWFSFLVFPFYYKKRHKYNPELN